MKKPPLISYETEDYPLYCPFPTMDTCSNQAVCFFYFF